MLDQVEIIPAEETDGISFAVTNKSGTQIGRVNIYVMMLNASGQVQRVRSGYTDKVYGAGYSDTVKVSYDREREYNTDGSWQWKYTKPASYLVFTKGAYIVEEE